jgi:hypothetical protein
MRHDFVALILTHDRAGEVQTLDALDRFGYDGPWVMVVDHPDDVEPYTDAYGADHVYYVDKGETQPEFDRGINAERKAGVVYARFQSWAIARDLGYDYFIQLDDDYNWFGYRFNEAFDYIGTEYVPDLDATFDNAIDYLERADLDTVCFAQGGDFIGGAEAQLAQHVQAKRKAMNTFICRTDAPFAFRGAVNEDVTTYVRAQQLGKVFLTVNFVSFDQNDTQQKDGGLTEKYLDEGTYIKSMYTVLYSPSSVTLQELVDRNDARIHHRVNWRTSVPKIVPESCRNE